jgi:hypothetical protein
MTAAKLSRMDFTRRRKLGASTFLRLLDEKRDAGMLLLLIVEDGFFLGRVKGDEPGTLLDHLTIERGARALTPLGAATVVTSDVVSRAAWVDLVFADFTYQRFAIETKTPPLGVATRWLISLRATKDTSPVVLS